MDFVAFGEKMTLILINDSMTKVVEYVDVSKVKKIDAKKESDKKPLDHNGKKAEGVAVDVTPKEKKLELPTSGTDGVTQNQKALKEETDSEERKIGALIEYIKKNPELNKNRYTPIIKNLQRKRREGSYDASLAEKGFRILVDEGASKYFNDEKGKLLGQTYTTQQEMFPTSIRQNVSKEFLKEFEANVEMGNLEQEESKKKINEMVDKSKENMDEQISKEAVAFTPKEIAEFKKFDNAEVKESLISLCFSTSFFIFSINLVVSFTVAIFLTASLNLPIFSKSGLYFSSKPFCFSSFF
jgi:hypothetical protein